LNFAASAGSSKANNKRKRPTGNKKPNKDLAESSKIAGLLTKRKRYALAKGPSRIKGTYYLLYIKDIQVLFKNIHVSILNTYYIQEKDVVVVDTDDSAGPPDYKKMYYKAYGIIF
jgi:hypothetical protein